MNANRQINRAASALLWVWAVGLAASARAQEAAPPEAAPAPKIIAIVGGDIYTVTREVVRRGTLLIRDGKILRIGVDVPVPEGAEVVDAKGMYVVPGFIALNASRIGLSGQIGGQNEVADALDPFDRNIEFCLGSGITTVVISTGGGGGGGRRGGRGGGGGGGGGGGQVVLKLTHRDLNGMVLAEDRYLEIPANRMTGQLNRFNWRQDLNRAKEFIQQQESGGGQRQAARGGGRGARGRAGGSGGRGGGGNQVDRDLVRLLRREVALHTSARGMDDIRDLVGLAKEYNYRLVLEGVQEGWLLADELNSAGVSVIVTPRNQMAAREGFEDTSGSSIAMAAVLESAGVPFAINAMSGSIGLGGIVGRDLMSLPFEAAFAVRGGASEQAALAAITIVPAELLGLQDRIGSLEEGKDADILIMDAHPLDYRAYVETAFVNGKVYYRRDVNRVFPVFKRTDR